MPKNTNKTKKAGTNLYLTTDSLESATLRAHELKTCSRANAPCVLTLSRATMPSVLMCSRASVPYVLTYLRANVPCMLMC